jgi:hypothetical protein
VVVLRAARGGAQTGSHVAPRVGWVVRDMASVEGDIAWNAQLKVSRDLGCRAAGDVDTGSIYTPTSHPCLRRLGDPMGATALAGFGHTLPPTPDGATGQYPETSACCAVSLMRWWRRTPFRTGPTVRRSSFLFLGLRGTCNRSRLGTVVHGWPRFPPERCGDPEIPRIGQEK